MTKLKSTRMMEIHFRKTNILTDCQMKTPIQNESEFFLFNNLLLIFKKNAVIKR